MVLLLVGLLKVLVPLPLLDSEVWEDLSEPIKLKADLFCVENIHCAVIFHIGILEFFSHIISCWADTTILS